MSSKWLAGGVVLSFGPEHVMVNFGPERLFV